MYASSHAAYKYAKKYTHVLIHTYIHTYIYTCIHAYTCDKLYIHDVCIFMPCVEPSSDPNPTQSCKAPQHVQSAATRRSLVWQYVCVWVTNIEILSPCPTQSCKAPQHVQSAATRRSLVHFTYMKMCVCVWVTSIELQSPRTIELRKTQ